MASACSSATGSADPWSTTTRPRSGAPWSTTGSRSGSGPRPWPSSSSSCSRCSSPTARPAPPRRPRPRSRRVMPERFTLGIEEEFQIVDPGTRLLKSHIEEMLAAGAHLGDQIKPELHKSVVEVGTPVCADIREADLAVRHLRRALVTLAEAGGARIVAAGTHPISHWKDQEITDRVRYKDIVNEMEDLARANLIFGLHVHVGVEDR